MVLVLARCDVRARSELDDRGVRVEHRVSRDPKRTPSRGVPDRAVHDRRLGMRPRGQSADAGRRLGEARLLELTVSDRRDERSLDPRDVELVEIMTDTEQIDPRRKARGRRQPRRRPSR